MPFSRLSRKLLLAFGGLNLAAAVIFGAVVSNWQETRLVDQVERRLHDVAALLRDELAEKLRDGRSEALQEHVRGLGHEIGVRVTLVSADGTVLADSERANVAEVATMDNHRDRPEIVRALARGEGASERKSGTFDESFSYFALRVGSEEEPVGVVRTAVTLASVEQAAVDNRWRVWILALGVSLATTALAYFLIGHIVHPMAEISQAADAIAKGDYGQRLYVDSRDELGRLAATLNGMCHSLDTRMRQLTQSHERQATVLGGMIEGVIAVDRRERVVFANTAAGRLFDFRPAAAEGRRLLEVVRSHALDEAVSVALATRQPQRLETAQEASGKQCIAIQATPLPGDPCPGVVLVMHDTTELRRLESLRRDFVANVSHELKTPLASIKAYAETLRNGALNDPEASTLFVERIQEQAERLHHLILDMLSLARIESAHEVFEIEPVSVQEAVDACFARYRPAAEAKRIELVTESPPTSYFVRADKEGLNEILDNLIDNAIKYTPAEGRVAVRWRATEGSGLKMGTIEVEDTGIGIPVGELPRVFERFYRVDKARSRELGGTGLGLAIVKHLTQSFGGAVAADSPPGRGSIFTIQLPLA